MTKNDSAVVVDLGRFLIKKIIAQEARRKEFNFAKLKSITIVTDDSEIEIVEDLDDMDEEMGEESMFMGYDIDMDDMEDNIEGHSD
jgi:hypothetical protein